MNNFAGSPEMESRASQKRKAVLENDIDRLPARRQTSKLMKLSSPATTYSLGREISELAAGSADAGLPSHTPGATRAVFGQDQYQYLSWSMRGHHVHQVDVSGQAQVNVGDHLAFEGPVTQHIHRHVYHRASEQERKLSALQATLNQQSAMLSQQQAIMNQLADNIAIDPDNAIQFEGDNVQAILLPLLTIEPDFANALYTMAMQGDIIISPTELQWLRDEFNNLIVMGCKARCTPDRYSPKGTNDIPSIHASRKQNSFKRSATNSSTLAARRSKDRKTVRSLSVETRIGPLRIVIQKGGWKKSDLHSQSLGVRFSWYPRHDSYGMNGLTAMFSRHVGMQHVYRHIRVFNVRVDLESELDILVAEDNVQALRKKFLDGAATIYDCNEFGNSLLVFAIRHDSRAVFTELLNLGAPLRLCSVYQSLLDYSTPTHNHSLPNDTEGRLRRLLYALQHDNYFEDTSTGYLDDILTLVTQLDYELEIGDEMCNRISTILCDIVDQVLLSSVDLDRIDMQGYTPLLCLCRYGRDAKHPLLFEKLIKKLVGEDAGIHAVDKNRRNSLHILVQLRKPFTSFHTYTLRLLLVAGCDPNGLTSEGDTPSDYIRIHNRENFPVWIEALQSCGYRLLTNETANGITFDVVSGGASLLPVNSWALDTWSNRRLGLFSSAAEQHSCTLEVWLEWRSFPLVSRSSRVDTDHIEYRNLPMGKPNIPNTLDEWSEWRYFSTSDAGARWTFREWLDWKWLDDSCTLEEALEWKLLPFDPACDIHEWSEWVVFSKSDAGQGWSFLEWSDWMLWINEPCTLEEALEWKSLPASISCSIREWSEWTSFSKSHAGMGWTFREWLDERKRMSSTDAASDRLDEHQAFSSEDSVQGDDGYNADEDSVNEYEMADEEIPRVSLP